MLAINQFKLQYNMVCNFSRNYLILAMTVFFKPTEERSFFPKVQRAENAEDGEDYQNYLTSSSKELDSVKLRFYLYFSTVVS